jgi:MFS family permease
MRLWSLMIALLVQAVMGLLSDRSTLRWGRRRPFIVAGTLGELVVLSLIGAIAGMEGMAGYWVLFGLYSLSMVASNAAHAATQGLIPDLVPEDQRGRFSGVKALLELPVPLVFTSFVVANMVAAGNLTGALVALMAVLFICMVITMFVRERPPSRVKMEVDWQPILRLALMTGAFTLVILGMGTVVNAAMTRLALSSAMTVIAGIAGMALAVLVGVRLSVALSLGREERDDHKGSFTWWVTNRLAFMVASTNLAGFMLYFLQERFAFLAGEQAAGPASRVMMFVGLFIMATALPAGWLADRLGKKLLVAAAGLVAAGGTFLILLVPSMTAMYVGGSLIGAAIGLFYSANWALGTEIVPQARAGHFLGISNLAGAGAGAIGAYIGGPIADANGYVALFTIYGAMFLLSILALRGVNEHRPEAKA